MPIVRDETICFNQPILKGRRLTVYNIISALYYTDNIDEYTNDFQITKKDIRDAINYCKNTICSKFEKKGAQYCDGCILRTISEGDILDTKKFVERGANDKVTISKDEKIIFLGSINELENTEFGSVGWIMAEEVEKKFFPHESPPDLYKV